MNGRMYQSSPNIHGHWFHSPWFSRPPPQIKAFKNHALNFLQLVENWIMQQKILLRGGGGWIAILCYACYVDLIFALLKISIIKNVSAYKDGSLFAKIVPENYLHQLILQVIFKYPSLAWSNMKLDHIMNKTGLQPVSWPVE